MPAEDEPSNSLSIMKPFLKAPIHHSIIELRGIWGAHNWGPNIPTHASLSAVDFNTSDRC